MPDRVPKILSKPLAPGFLRTLWERDRDPYLDLVRWRLHLRLLLLAATAGAAFALLNQSRPGIFGMVSIPIIASLAAWLILSRSPVGNRLAVRVNMTLFVGVAMWITYSDRQSSFPGSLLGLMVMPVFGVLLDGMLTGGLTLLACLAMVLISVSRESESAYSLTLAFCGIAAVCLYSTSLAHTWIFGSLVERQRADRQAVDMTSQAAEGLAQMLAQQVVKTNARLRERLNQGFDILGETEALQSMLTAARTRLPVALPQGAVDPGLLLDRLRHEAHRAYLLIGCLVSAFSAMLVMAMGLQRWQVAVLVALAGGLVLRADSLRPGSWRLRLRIFALMAFLAIASDVVFPRDLPPTHSLVFLPVLVFYIAMLDTRRAAVSTCALGIGLLAFAQLSLDPFPGQPAFFARIAVLLVTLLIIALSVHPLYRGLLAQFAEEEETLRWSLQAYRQAVSTLFHDLANPLSVLQGLAALPKDLLKPEDLQRAKRMLDRLDSVAASHASSGATSFGELVESLRDLFKERLETKALGFEVVSGADLMLAVGGPRLRESVLGNLVSNTIKYAPSGSRVELSARREDAFFVLRLKDEGPGFPDAVLKDVLKGDTPVSSPGTQGESGSGFGLLLASAYVREFGGRLDLRNAPGGGAEAEIWLPA
jgi:signal transduction histidine kinase